MQTLAIEEHIARVCTQARFTPIAGIEISDEDPFKNIKLAQQRFVNLQSKLHVRNFFHLTLLPTAQLSQLRGCDFYPTPQKTNLKLFD